MGDILDWDNSVDGCDCDENDAEERTERNKMRATDFLIYLRPSQAAIAIAMREA